jgi:hypothetical protein
VNSKSSMSVQFDEIISIEESYLVRLVELLLLCNFNLRLYFRCLSTNEMTKKMWRVGNPFRHH